MKTSLKVEGMTCVNCARTIEINLKRLKGVKSVEVSFELGRVQVEFDEELLSVENIKEAIESLGYRVSKGTEERNKDLFILLFCIFISLFFIPLMFFHNVRVEFVLASLVQIIGGYSFYKSAYRSLISGVGNMDLLVALGSTGAYLYSVLTMLKVLEGSPFFETSVFLITFVRLGKYLEERAKERAVKSLKELFGIQTSKVRLLRKDGKEEEKNVQEVFIGDIILLRTGDLVPLDVYVLEGKVEVDESVITGESKPVLKTAGQRIFSGSLIINGYAKAKVEKTLAGSYVSLLIKLVEDALKQKPKIHRIADRVAHYFVQVVVIISLLVFTLWYLSTGDLQKSVSFALSVLVISCPCAFGIAVPLVLTVGLLRAYRKGLLVKNPSVLERIKDIDVLLLDKTGTLTESIPKVVKAVFHTEDALDLAFSVANASNHPRAKAIRDYCEQMKAKTVSLQDCTEVPGEGIYCGDYYLGNPSALGMNHKNSITVLTKGKEIIGEFHLEERIRSDVKDTLNYLKNRGIKLVMITGDAQENARRIANALGIEEFYAEVKPEDKLAVLEKYQSMGHRVGMVGDGINDAPAMAKAHVSFAVGSGTDIAKRVCDVVILSGLQGIKDLFEMADVVSRRIKQNLFWAFFYNALGIPVAGGLFSSYGVVLKPEIAGLMMVLSSLSVVINSIRK
ncbi:heavy metal translocating P-type ATPase [Hydrogenobacter hydrogenophilus]|uniref:Cu2+-exporting ATPase/Cu+-exporting ATPase n=1 Tax=Hydrogenobacter hydrogenophilus TaxID=35835 RepID=A0A285NX37_9AQUI|nr:cation-translocating P-type ATPase [Hydrogenobacter hydrogenophilus]SNZ14050.1 Cu2+-exporting ATPase/Cu+-exporting ATPase [Hydrogenobacter hydrogenophilus]